MRRSHSLVITQTLSPGHCLLCMKQLCRALARDIPLAREAVQRCLAHAWLLSSIPRHPAREDLAS
ncbi:hypothetical protein MYCTH_2311539 [Thermothelomyces thermophilus ATCC 42464]|uniref:Uncharacterized protein n=1 Tax=Thermothelomyces thermophilus (strain ATCC 42464 / BCRC 31852 / DSM 1799) TaxID=573729 RepID=G2QP97_THET4|nr:uncharacterized protein MYCTH_2311539 [Thermothelomyces thermophilus ATCC 42464]AEO61410.1 hypothetical protein MYCTH_2311539 [Thermothelomyces thermophilus ATCC 42464]